MAKVPPKNRRKMVGVKLRQKGAKRLAPVVVKQRNKVDAIINKAVRDPRFATSEAVRQRYYNQIAQEYAKYQTNINAWSKSYATAVARVWRKLAIADVARGTKTYSQSWGGFSKKYLQDIIKRVNPQTMHSVAAVNARLGGMLQKDIGFLRGAVAETTRLAASEGWTAQEIRKHLRERVQNEQPGWAFVDAGGKKWKDDVYFKMLVKTMYNNIANDTYGAVMAETGYDLATLEGGPSTVGDSCDDWVGRIVSVTGATKGYPTLGEAMSSSHMFGPNCNHWLGVVLDDVPSELEEAKVNEEVTQKQVKSLDKFRNELTDSGYTKKQANQAVKTLSHDLNRGVGELTDSQLEKRAGSLRAKIRNETMKKVA